jgi:hypothetical protein
LKPHCKIDCKYIIDIFVGYGLIDIDRFKETTIKKKIKDDITVNEMK